MQRKKIIALLSILLTISIACSFGFLENSNNQTLDETGANENLPSTDGFDNSGQDIDSPLEQPQAGETVDLTQGLSGLESFRFQLKQTINGLDETGNQVEVKMSHTQEVIKPLDIFHVKLESETTGEPLQVLEVFRYGNEVYIIDTEQSTGIRECSAYQEDFVAFDEEEDLGLTLFFNQVALGEMIERGATVNNLLSDHYKVVNMEMVNSDLNSLAGDIWITQEGGYVVQFTGSAEGQLYSQSEEVMITGTSQWEFSLVEVNQITDIPLPEDCQMAAEGGVNDIPTPENVQNLSVIGSMISFTVPDATGLLADFYRLEMATAGYQLVEEIAYEGSFAFTYQKADETITILLTQIENSGSDATIIVEVE